MPMIVDPGRGSIYVNGFAKRVTFDPSHSSTMEIHLDLCDVRDLHANADGLDLHLKWEDAIDLMGCISVTDQKLKSIHATWAADDAKEEAKEPDGNDLPF